ncbi:hypothetical protein [Cuspidothrix issatschenkoi]|jgi:hypothetical protein|uniref:Competence protein CoiA-like N-terminal domain-containing protein n=1 Tax=Cuspidothrix issatschenkoi CHARLIE-1 TaxID=2052836 RepID=A0A2S6CRF7_9CYAN|nr:hypothetical protein [Cuspidothrix issatschenkoi]PPJ62364.1 hypothetical protein CUN59_15920 [Cuspidothrix issatschenkoi CHARLIE-1]
MFYAKAMYQGSEIPVCAEDKNIDYYSYRLLGLRCIVCGEEVQFRKGYVNRPHFAHFKDIGINPNKCELRVIGYSSSWSSLTSEGKGQRRKLFQEHFINIIKRQDSSFDHNIQILKSQLSSNSLKEITNKCRICFDSKKEDLIRECRQFNTGVNDSNNWIHGLIASEAIDYLSIPTSIYPLEVLLHYSIYIACNQSKSNNWNIFISTIEPNTICQILKEVIVKTNWLIAFGNLYKNKTGIYSENSILNYHTNDFINEKLAKSVEKYISLHGNQLKRGISKGIGLKLEGLNINLFTLKLIVNVVGVGSSNPQKAYIYDYIYDKTIAQIIDIDQKMDQIYITYEIIYHQGISNLEYYENFRKEISYFLENHKKQPDQKITFTLSNWEEIRKLSNEEKQRKVEEEQLRRKQVEIVIDQIKNSSNWRKHPAIQIVLKTFSHKIGRTPIKCPICTKKTRKHKLLDHLKKVHIDSCKSPSEKLIDFFDKILSTS